MRCLSLLGALLCLAIGTVAQGDALDRTRIAEIAGSERLRLFAQGKVLETGRAPRSAINQMKQKLFSQGFYYAPGERRVIARDVWVAPLLSYDGNINGGVLQDNFTFNGFVFDADPASRAKAGVVMGLAAGGVARVAWANGRYVEGRLRGEAVWSPEHHIGRSAAEISVCSRNHVTGWTFMDLCHSASVVQRERGSSTAQETALSATQLFQTGAGYHEMTAEFAQTRTETGRQPSVTLAWGTVWNKAATKLSLTKAAPIAGETALDSRITADVQWLWGARAVGVGVWHQRANGGAFLGMARTDEASGLSLSYQLRPGLTAQLGYMANHSNIDFFDYSQTSVSLRLDALRW